MGWAHRNSGAAPAPQASPPPPPQPRSSNLFANTLSILAITVSGLSAWYTADSEKRIAKETIRSQNRAVLYVGNEFGLFTNQQQESLQVRFLLDNSGQTSAKNLLVKVSTYADRPDDMGHPPGTWPAPQVVKLPQIEKSIPVTLAVPDQSREAIRDIFTGRKALWVNIGVVYEDEWGQRYDTTKCFSITGEGGSASAQLCTDK